MFCYNCGTKLADGTNFCPVCGTKQSGGSGKALEKGNTKESPVSSALLADAGQLHDQFYRLSVSVANDFAENYTERYATLDGFVRRANADVESIFDKVDDCILQFLSKQGIYSYGKKQVKSISRNYVTEWNDVLNGAMLAYQNITGELQNIKKMREYEKAGRGRLVGGGFGLSGAVKGMATAGAVNMASGALYSLANGLANIRSEEKASAEKNRFYCSRNLKEAVRLALAYDIFAMLETVKVIWEDEKHSSFPHYSSADYERACNIKDKIGNGEIPKHNIGDAVFQMLEAYPVSEELYIYADRILPDNNQIWNMALKYGFNFEIIRAYQEGDLKNAAIGLKYAYLFLDNYRDITYDMDQTLEMMSEKYSRFLGYEITILTGDAMKQSDVRKCLGKMHDVFADYGQDELPLLMYDNATFSRGSSGILLTDEYLYFKGERGRSCRIGIGEYDRSFNHLEKVSDDATIYKYSLDKGKEYYTYVPGGEYGLSAGLLELLIEFLSAYSDYKKKAFDMNLGGDEFVYPDVEELLETSVEEQYERVIKEKSILCFLHQFIDNGQEGLPDAPQEEETGDMVDTDVEIQEKGADSGVSNKTTGVAEIISRLENSIFHKLLDKSIYHEFFHPALNMKPQEENQYRKITSLYVTVSNKEEILFFYDNTMFRNMKEGFLLTTTGIHFRSERLSTGYVPYSQIHSVTEKQIKLLPNLIINDQYTIPMRFLSECSGEIVKLIDAFRN